MAGSVYSSFRQGIWMINFIGTNVFHPVTENTGKFDWTSYALDWQTFEQNLGKGRGHKR